MGIKKLRKLQIGGEATPGTAVAATTIYRVADVAIEDGIAIVHPEEDVGVLIGTDRAYSPSKEAFLSIPEHEATFEQVGYHHRAGLVEVASGTADGAGAGKIYTHAVPTTALQTIKTLTMECGDDQEAERMEYCFCKKWTESGKPKEAIKIASEWVGRQAAVNAFTGSLSIPTVEEMLFQNTKLYLNGVGTFPATTQFATTLLGYKLEVTTGWRENFTADGNLYFSNHRFDGDSFEAILTLIMEHNSNATDEKVAWRARTPRAVKLITEGSSITAGTTYSKKTYIRNLLGCWEKFTKLDSQNGNDITEGTLRCRWDPTANSAGNFIIVNTLASLP